MDSRCTVDPSPPTTSIRDLLVQFRQSVSSELLSALEERDAQWRTDTEVFRSQRSDCSELNRRLEENRLVIAKHEEEGRWLRLSIRGLEEEDRSRKEESDRERKRLEDELVDRDRIIEGLKKERAEFVSEIRQVKSKKNDEVDRVSKEKKELEARVRNLERDKSGEIRRNSNLKKTLEAVEKKKKTGEYQKRIELLEKDNEIGRVMNDKMRRSLHEKEAEIRRLEEELKKKKIPIQVLKKEMGQRNAGLQKGEKSTVIDRILNGTNAQSSRMEAKMKEEIDLVDQIRVLETAFERAIKEMDDSMKKSLEVEKRRLEEKTEKISELEKSIEDLQKEKVELEAKVCKTNKDKNDTLDKIVELNEALEAQTSRAEKAENQVSRNLTKIDVLKRQREVLEAKVLKGTRRIGGVLEKEEIDMDEKNEEIKRLMNEKKALEARNRDAEDESNERASELLKRIGLLKKEKKELEAKVCQANKEKSAEIKRISIEKEALEKRAVEHVDSKKVSELVKRIEVLEEEKKDMKAKLCLAKKKDEEIHRMLNEKLAIEDEKRALKEDYHKTILELDDRNDILESEKLGLEAELVERDEVIKVLDGEKRGFEAGVVERDEVIKVLEREKRGFEAEVAKKDQVINELEREKRGFEAGVTERDEVIKVLEREKRGFEAEVAERDEVIKVLEKEKWGFEAKVAERDEVIKVLDREKRGLEAGVVERDEMIKVLDREKQGFEADVAERDEVIKELEREKRGLEAEVAERDEVIKVLAQEISCLENKQKELETEISLLASKSKEGVHHTNNIVTSSTPPQNEGQKFADVGYSSEHSRSINHGVENSSAQCEAELIRNNVCKRKRSIRTWKQPVKKICKQPAKKKSKQPAKKKSKPPAKKLCKQPAKKILMPACVPLPTTLRSTGVDAVGVKPVLLPCTNGINGGDVQVANGNIACNWKVAQDALDAFDVHPELCLKAVCALYRQIQRLGTSASPSLSHEGVVLAEYIMSEDPEGRKTNKMVVKLDKFDKDAVGKCINIAKQHYKQVFDIYEKKEDLVFLC